MKRLSCLFLAATMALTLAACGGGSAEAPAPGNTTPPPAPPGALPGRGPTKAAERSSAAFVFVFF